MKNLMRLILNIKISNSIHLTNQSTDKSILSKVLSLPKNKKPLPPFGSRGSYENAYKLPAYRLTTPND